jgi:hypothetical protein
LNSQWKSFMTKAEAEDYTKGSYYEGQDFFHGTSSESALGIIAEGAKLTSDRVNTYGDGFYLAFRREIAFEYANSKYCPCIVKARVRVNNPKQIADSIDLDEFLIENNIPFDDSQASTLTNLLLIQGYDALEVGGDRILVIIFDPKQIAVFQIEEL